jgi:hypothetical protein
LSTDTEARGAGDAQLDARPVPGDLWRRRDFLLLWSAQGASSNQSMTPILDPSRPTA